MMLYIIVQELSVQVRPHFTEHRCTEPHCVGHSARHRCAGHSCAGHRCAGHRCAGHRCAGQRCAGDRCAGPLRGTRCAGGLGPTCSWGGITPREGRFSHLAGTGGGRGPPGTHTTPVRKRPGPVYSLCNTRWSFSSFNDCPKALRQQQTGYVA